MNNGWVKLHRKIRENEFLVNDMNAWVVFTHLLTLVDKETGTWRGGRKKLAMLCGGMNDNTIRGVLLRLQKHQQLIIRGTNRFTVFSICNWQKYQQADTSQTRAAQRKKATITRIEKENKDTNVSSRRVSDETARSVYQYYLEVFRQSESRYKLTDIRKRKLLARIEDAGPETLKQAISAVAASPFHRGENERGWKADLDFIIRSYEQVEKFANQETEETPLSVEEALKSL